MVELLSLLWEANAKLCMSHLMVEVQVGPRVPILSSTRHAQPPSAPSPGGSVLGLH